MVKEHVRESLSNLTLKMLETKSIRYVNAVPRDFRNISKAFE